MLRSSNGVMGNGNVWTSVGVFHETKMDAGWKQDLFDPDGRVGELLETVRRVSLLSVDKSTNIKLNFRENELEVASSAEGVGEAHESMTITYSGRPLSISFNPDFFMAPLKTMAGDTVITLNLIDEMSPGVLKIGDEFLYVLMPMRSPN